MQFNHPRIQQAYNLANSHFIKRMEFINNMYEDFENLQKFLHDLLNGITFEYDINEDEVLSFSDRFYYQDFQSDKGIMLLLECDLNIKFMIYEKLPEFLNNLLTHLKSNWQKPI
jgi:hypothetical protein